MNDPFNLLHDALWKLVERSSYITDTFRKGNKIKYETESDKKAIISDGDLPELELYPGGFNFNGKRDSSTIYCEKEYIWAITTGSIAIPKYNRITFELFRCMTDWECILCPLTWCECPFVKDLRLASVEEGDTKQSKNRGIYGWVGLWTVQVSLGFSINKIRLPPPL